MKNSFASVAATEDHAHASVLTSRLQPLYKRDYEIRSAFAHDYTRIIHSTSYRRLKHKAQVFYAPTNDHICTRIEHVNHVESISYTLATYLGLNTELTKAISVAHDLGHAPFGHKGEKVLSAISERDLGCPFWHERNGLYVVDFLELLENPEGKLQNLNLTYAVRDGIISHCGEVDENALRPRDIPIDLEKEYTRPNQFAPYTWEACVVKIADKISYIGRDIEDALTMGVLEQEELQGLFTSLGFTDKKVMNNSVIIHNLIRDLCEHSSIENGLCFSDEGLALLNSVKKFNYAHIYLNPLLSSSERYFSLVLHEIYNHLASCFDGLHTLERLREYTKYYPCLMESFANWLEDYAILPNRKENLENVPLYSLSSYPEYCKAILSFIANMTDNFAIAMFEEIVAF